MSTKSTAADRPRAQAEPGILALVCLVSWLIPGAGHLWLGRRRKGLVFLGAIADRGIGAPYFIARLLDYGAGLVTAASYEYGNTYLMTAGLLNFLVILDAFDIALGRK